MSGLQEIKTYDSGKSQNTAVKGDSKNRPNAGHPAAVAFLLLRVVFFRVFL